MTNKDLIPSLLFKLNENQLAIAQAVEELTLWVELRDSTTVAGNVRRALGTIDENLEFITLGIAELMND